jgi:hypothetical protein
LWPKAGHGVKSSAVPPHSQMMPRTIFRWSDRSGDGTRTRNAAVPAESRLNLGVRRLAAACYDVRRGICAIPYEIETFSGVFVQGISFLSGPNGYPLAQNDFTFASSQTSYSGSVPEPASIVLLCAGLAGLLVLSRKKLSFS